MPNTLADGFHRLHASRAAERAEVECNIVHGTRRDAVLYSVGANTSHGLRRTNEDKRKAVLTLLKDDEWAQWSAREIAKVCAVDHRFVDRLRDSLGIIPSEKSDPKYTTKHGTISTMNTTNIGKPTEKRYAARAERAASATA
jgi:hypothetical protein